MALDLPILPPHLPPLPSVLAIFKPAERGRRFVIGRFSFLVYLPDYIKVKGRPSSLVPRKLKPIADLAGNESRAESPSASKREHRW